MKLASALAAESVSMNYFPCGVASLQERERIIGCIESLDPTIFVYNASIPVRHKATIPHFLDLMQRPVGDVELGRFLRGVVG